MSEHASERLTPQQTELARQTLGTGRRMPSYNKAETSISPEATYTSLANIHLSYVPNDEIIRL